jgi:hypothetical protein
MTVRLTPEEHKAVNKAAMNELAALQLRNILCLAEDELVIWYNHSTEGDNTVVEVRTQTVDDVIPFVHYNIIRLSFKKVPQKEYLENKLKLLGYEPPEIS